MKKSIQLVALLLTVVMGSCTGGKDKAATEHVVEKPKVKVADVKARPVDQIQEYTATVEAEAKNNIAPSSPVRIDQIFVEVGDRVSKGQINPEKPDVPLNKNDAFQKVQKRRVQEKR